MGHFRVPQPLYENEVGAKYLISSHTNDGQFDMKDFALGLFFKLGFWKLETVHLRSSLTGSGRDMTQNV